jgi:hypothetical protein
MHENRPLIDKPVGLTKQGRGPNVWAGISYTTYFRIIFVLFSDLIRAQSHSLDERVEARSLLHAALSCPDFKKKIVFGYAPENLCIIFEPV